MCKLGIISDIQVSEVMYANKNLTLSWDSTTVDAWDINDLHISVHTVPVTSYVLHAIRCYSLWSNRRLCFTSVIQLDSYDFCIQLQNSLLYVRSTILNHFKNTLTDRVAEQKQNILHHRHIISVKSTGKVPKATNCYWTQ